MARFFYNLLINFFYIPFTLIILFRKILNKEHNVKYKEKFLSFGVNRPDGFLFWFHASSLGELNSIIPIIDFYLKKNQNYKFLITTITLSSYNEFKKKYGDNKRIFHQFLPYDMNFLIKSFFNKWKPNIISFVDSEIWPNFIFKIKKEKIPLILINARLTKKTFKRWKFLKKFASEIFSCFSSFIVSNKETYEYLRYFNAKNVLYFGNIKFCSSNIEKNKNSDHQFNKVINKNLWCALSIHPGEEVFCGAVQKIIKNKNKNSVAVIIPRHVHKVKKIYSSLIDMGFNVQIKNEDDEIEGTSEIVIVNYYGATFKYLEKIKNVFVGKSIIKKLKNDGGQNPIDAAKMGCNIFYGPYVYNFQEIYNYLEDEKIADKVNKPGILAEKILRNFDLKSQNKILTSGKIEEYSKTIFKNVINEYEKFLK